MGDKGRIIYGQAVIRQRATAAPLARAGTPHSLRDQGHAGEARSTWDAQSHVAGSNARDEVRDIVDEAFNKWDEAGATLSSEVSRTAIMKDIDDFVGRIRDLIYRKWGLTPTAPKGSETWGIAVDLGTTHTAISSRVKLSLVEEYNNAAASDDDGAKSAIITRVGHKRLTVPDGTIGASGAFSAGKPIAFVEQQDGMFFVADEGTRILLFPVFRIKAEQRTLLDDCFEIQGRETTNGLSRVRVVRVDRPAECSRSGDEWVLKGKGAITIGPSK